jgi:hypothetical protein
MTRLLRAWNELFFAPTDGCRIAAVRILLGLYLLAYFGLLLPHTTLSFSNQGVYVPYLVPDYAPAPWVAAILLGVMLALCTALLVGYRTAIATPLLLALFAYHYFLSLAVKQSSFDRLIAIYLLILSFSDAGAVFGLDARRRKHSPVVWGERMLIAQTVFLYFGAGLWKLCNPSWHTGTLLRSTLQGMWATPIAFEIVRADFGATTWAVFSFTIIAFELVVGPLLLMRRTRTVGLVLGAGFHVLNCVVLSIPEFLVCLVPYPVFMDPSKLAAAFDRVSALARRRAGPTG